jgi:hypothetical protein
MVRRYKFAAFFLVLAASVTAQDIPQQLQGKWRVKRMLPAGGVSCWSGKEATRLIGTEIEYTQGMVRWGKQSAVIRSVKESELTADQFGEANSASGGWASLSDLGIQAPRVTQITIMHADLTPIKGASEVVGEDAIIRDRNTIIIDPCGVYFVVVRVPS